MKVFSRSRTGLQPPRGSYATAGRLWHCSIHHGGAVGGPPLTFRSGAAKWRSYQAWHFAQGWTDIGYNVGVDGLGRLYEGRPPGKLPAAVGNHNSNSIGIVFMQDGDRYGLTLAQRRTLKALFKQGNRELGIPPLKGLLHIPGPHGGVFGHKEYSGHGSNACPGRKILSTLKRYRKAYG
jgi:hypothetical protein